MKKPLSLRASCLGFATICIAPSAFCQQNIVTVRVGANPGAAAVDVSTNQVYVVDEGSDAVSVIDGRNNNLKTTNTRIQPSDIAVNALTTLPIARITTAMRLPQCTAMAASERRSTSGRVPLAVAVNQITNRIYVANEGDNTVTAINGDDLGTTTIPVGLGPSHIAVNSAANKVYVSDIFGSYVTVIDGTSYTTTKIPVAAYPYVIAINESTNKIYVGNGNGSVITVIDGDTNTTSEISVPPQPSLLAVNPVTNKVFVLSLGTLAVIDGATATIERQISIGTQLNTVSVNTVTNTIYVVDGATTNLTIIDGTSHGLSFAPVGSAPFGAIVNPTANKVYVSNSNDGTVTVLSF